jgi:hypothetical protein
MSNTQVTYLVAAGCAVIALTAFITLVVAPVMHGHRRGWQRLVALVLSGYVLAAFVGAGIVLGAWVVLQWPKWF